MRKSVDEKINQRSHEEQNLFCKYLREIIEWKDLCAYYGAKNVIDPSKEDIQNIKKISIIEFFFQNKKNI